MQLIERRANWLTGLAGAVVGGAAGYVVFYFFTRAGLYMPALPGALTGVACGMLSRGRSLELGAVCGVLALALGIVGEWQFFPFREDQSLGFFLAHLHWLHWQTWAVILLGVIFAFWLGSGRRQFVPAPNDALGELESE